MTPEELRTLTLFNTVEIGIETKLIHETVRFEPLRLFPLFLELSVLSP